MAIGFIGLGNIGLPIARDLARASEPLFLFDVAEARVAELAAADDVHAVSSPAEVAAQSDLVGICVNDVKQVRSVMEGPDGILANAKAGLVVAIHSTIGVDAIKDIADRAAEAGVRVIDAPVSRGPKSQPHKGIVFMVGGNPDDIAAFEPYLDLVALKVIRTGSLGTAMALKICNNLLSYTTSVMANDAVRLARASGLDVELLADVTSNNGIASPAMTAAFQRYLDVPPAANVELPTADQLISLGHKDLDCALEVARNLGVRLPVAEMSRAEFAECVSQQWGDRGQV